MNDEDRTYLEHQTPPELCKKLIALVPLEPQDRVFEPFKGEGAFYDNFPDNVVKDWCEIRQGRNYKDHTGEYDWVITNPPFRIEGEESKKKENAIWKFLRYYSDRAKKGIAFLMNDNCFSCLTPNRLKELNDKGWFIHSITCCSVKKWRGRYFWVILQPKRCDFYKHLIGNF
jgi:type I restriction-modification system DNA methylase subunit